MDIREMKYIDTISKTRSLSKAALQLHISQPALHKALHKVENELNTTLFYKKGHESLPTDTGLIVLEYANRILSSLDEMKEKVSETQNLKSGNVTIGFPSVVGTLYLPETLIRFQKAYPDISLKTFEGGANELCALVENGTLDMAIVVRPVDSTALSEIPLLQDQVVVGVNKGHPWAKRDHITIQDFENVPFNTFEPSFSVHTQLMERFKAANITPHIAFSGGSSRFLYQVTTHSDGVLILPRPIITSLNKDQMALIPFLPSFPWELSLAFRKNSYLSIGAKVLIQHLQEHFFYHI